MSFRRLFSSLPSLFLLCSIFMRLVKSQSKLSNPYMSPPNCSRQFRCGSFTAGYPFWGGNRPSGCGHPDLELHCGVLPHIQINGITYSILKMDEKAQTLRIKGWNDMLGICDLLYGHYYYISDISPIFDYDIAYEMITVYLDCPVSPSYSLGNFTCPGYNVYIKAGASGPGEECRGHVTFPVSKSLNLAAIRNSSVLDRVIEEGFQVKWNVSGIACEECKSNGGCGYDVWSNQTICYCPNGQSSTPCPTPPAYQAPKEPSASPSSGSKIRDIFIGLAASLGTGIVIIVSVILIGYLGRKLALDKVVVFWEMKTENDKHIEAFVTNYGSLARKRYNFSDVKRMTKSFSDTLGQGRYGIVYKGKLPDGRLVAVKVLKESEGNGEEFINEVASISRTSHVNIVTLLGFCCEKNKRALVYEFMPNGSLDKFIHDQESSSPKRNLEWKIMYQIAVGIARGLDYLHRGCNTRIVHFDIKPHNILLDGDFCPKISDFGLAKQSNMRESIISMLEARGTVGYIAPEVLYRNFGGVSHKSDVYSYGMMILEMAGGRSSIDVRPSQGGEIYFPDSVYKYLEPGKDFVLHGVVTEQEKEMAKKMIFVSLWCIQTLPSDRPSMTKVVEMLEGSLEKLQIPPKPSGSSATISP